MNKLVIDATISALDAIQHPRYFKTERGYQGQFYHVLQNILGEFGVFENGDFILEEEHQKASEPHNTRQRPDIILHAPREQTGAQAYENNIAVWAFKRNASVNGAIDDFRKLDEMFENLHYPLGFFINIDSTTHHIHNYHGGYPDRIMEFVVGLINGEVTVSQAKKE